MASRRTFCDWMDIALYGPNGYYASGHAKSGRAGDYFTAPDVGPAFGQLLARIFQDWQKKLGVDPLTIVEVGAGEGRLSQDILQASAGSPWRYVAVERSPVRQDVLHALPGIHAVHEDLSPLLTTPVEGILFANELIDAFPVHRIRKRESQLEELFFERNQAVWKPVSTPRIKKYLARLHVELPDGYETEVNLGMSTWIRQAAGALKKGLIVIIDYGRPAWDYYSEERTQGTLRGFQNHQLIDMKTILQPTKALSAPKEFDLTADVDFTSLALDAREAGLTPLAFMEMGTFLSEGLKGASHLSPLALRYLLHPDGLGAQFHVLILGKKVDAKDWVFEFNRIKRLGLP